MQRDQYGIICQHDIYAPSKPLEGGDSACRTGIMAMCGSEIDQNLLPLFHVGDGKCVRHPFQSPANQAHTFSRDQAIPYMAGLWASGRTDIAKRVLKRILRNACFLENTRHYPSLIEKEFPHGPDFCHPGVIWHFILCAEFRWLYWLAPIGYLFQFLDMLWSCYVKPDSEQNQVFCMMFVSGFYPLYVKLHPDFEGANRKYWCGWRSQCIIAETIEKTAYDYITS